MKLIDIYEGKIDMNKIEYNKIDLKLLESDLEVYLEFLYEYYKGITNYLHLNCSCSKEFLLEVQNENKSILEKFTRIYGLTTKLKIQNIKLQNISMKIRMTHTVVKVLLENL